MSLRPAVWALVMACCAPAPQTVTAPTYPAPAPMPTADEEPFDMAEDMFTLERRGCAILASFDASVPDGLCP